MPTRKQRGSRTQAVVAEWYRRLWPAATSAGAGAAGRDVLNVPLDIEVKARRGFEPTAAVKQLRARGQAPGDALPGHVVLRPDGVGEVNVGSWLVVRPLAEDTELLAELLELRAKVAGLEGSSVLAEGGGA